MNSNGPNTGSNGMLHGGGMYGRNGDAATFQEQFWPQPMIDVSLVGLGPSQGPSQGQGQQMGVPGGSVAATKTSGNNAGHNNYYGFVGNANRQFNYSAQQQTLPLGDSTSDPPSPRHGASNSSHVKKRVAKACDHCRKRKIKCGELNPENKKCANCLKYGVECIFSSPRDEFDRKRKGSDDLARPHSSNSDGLNAIKFDVPLEYNVDIHSGIIGNHSVSNSDDIGNTQPQDDHSGRVEKLDRKVSVVIDKVSKLEKLIERLIKTHENEIDKKYMRKPISKHYSTTLLTIQKLFWFKRKNCPNESYQWFLSPIRELMTISMKWYFAQMKVTIDFSSPTFKNGYYNLHPIPPRAQSKRLVENFAALITSSAPGFHGLEYYTALVDKYYDSNGSSLSYAELLLLNTSICSGASRMRQVNSNDFYHLRKDKYNPTRKELKKIENDSLLNAIFYYNKVVIGSGGTIEIQGLLLLCLYLQENVNTDLAMTMLSTAIRFALDNEYNRRPPPNISLTEEAMRRTLWWHCDNKDKKFALLLSQPPIIRYEDTINLNDQQYYEFAKRILYTKYPQNKKEIDDLENVDSALNYIVKFSEFIPFFMSYTIQKLGKIEANIVDVCFSYKTIISYSFDQVVDKLLDIRKQLLDWETTLHPSMKLDSYKKYISLLYLPNDVDDPSLSYEFISSRVIVGHIRELHLRNLLCMFATSFLIDNADEFKATRHKVLRLYTMFEEEGLTSCIKILEVYQYVEYDRHMYNDSLYSFLTAAFALILYVTKNIQVTDNKKIAPILELLVKDHELLVGSNQEHLVSDNVKWNISLFFFTFLLSRVIHSFNERNPIAKNYSFTSEPYDAMLRKIITHMEILKNDALDGLQTCMDKYPYGDVSDSSSSIKEAEVIQFSPLSRCMCTNLNQGAMNHFRSNKNFKLSDKNTINLKNLSVDKDESLFPMESKFFENAYESFKPYTVPEKHADDNPSNLNQEIFPNESPDNINDLLDQFQDFFCQNELFFDRDLKFAKAMRDQVFQAS